MNEGVFQLAEELGLARRADQRRPLPAARGRRRPRHPALHRHGQVQGGHRTVSRSTARRATSSRPRRWPSCSRTGPSCWRTPCAWRSVCEVAVRAEYHLPNFPLPEASTPTWTVPAAPHPGGRQRALRRAAAGEVTERLEFELGVIEQTGYAGYFLIVWDFIRAARELRHPGGAGPRLGGRLDHLLLPADHGRRPAPRSTSCSSASSTPSACRCPTSTSTSATSAGARSSSTCARSTAPTRWARSSRSGRCWPGRRSGTSGGSRAGSRPRSTSSPSSSPTARATR